MQRHDLQRQAQCPHSRWRAITQRDPKAHGSFFYGVKTTRIYCRPTCTARVARRANVVYYDTSAQAQLDGFRPCIKCKPDDPTFMGQQEEVVMRTLGLLRHDPGHAIVEGGLQALAKDVGVTPSYLCRVFKSIMGCTIGQYCRQFEEVLPGSIDEAAVPVLPEMQTRSETETAEELSEAADVASVPQGSFEHRYTTSPDGCAPTFADVDRSLEKDMSLNFDEWLWTEELVPND